MWCEVWFGGKRAGAQAPALDIHITVVTGPGAWVHGADVKPTVFVC
jgi:hypothetical protein